MDSSRQGADVTYHIRPRNFPSKRKEESHASIQSEKGILNRQIRSIQAEGYFGDIKENDIRSKCATKQIEIRKIHGHFIAFVIILEIFGQMC